MNGRLLDTFALVWVYDCGKHEAVAFDEGTDLNDFVKKYIKTAGLQIHVNDYEIANLGRLHAKQHCVQHAECTASP